MSSKNIGYVTEARLEAMLDEWGREYRIDRQELLGHQSRNALYDLMKFGGRIPVKTGYKPDEVSPNVEIIERAIQRLYVLNPKAAICARFLYCSRGSIQIKAEYASNMLGENVSKATFKTMVRMAQMFVLGELNAKAA